MCKTQNIWYAEHSVGVSQFSSYCKIFTYLLFAVENYSKCQILDLFGIFKCCFGLYVLAYVSLHLYPAIDQDVAYCR